MVNQSWRSSLAGRIRWMRYTGVRCVVGDVMFIAGITSMDCPVRGRCVRVEHGAYDACYHHRLTDDAMDVVAGRPGRA